MKPKFKLSYLNYMYLNIINLFYNLKIKYKTDRKNYNEDEYWTVAKDNGDCEDIALAKMFFFIKHNKKNKFNNENLCIAEVYTENKDGIPGEGGGHAVLVVNTNKGSLVLDNRYMFVYPIQKARYLWRKMQFNEKWYTISIPNNTKDYFKYYNNTIFKIIYNFYCFIKYSIVYPRKLKKVHLIKPSSPPYGYIEFLYQYKSKKLDFKDEYKFWKFVNGDNINNEKTK